MRRMPLKLVVAAFALVGVLFATLVVLYQVYLGGSLGQSPAKVTVELAETGGLFERSTVTYRGVQVGHVDKIETTATGIKATLAIRPGTKVPADSDVAVRTLSPAGEQFLDFQPKSASGPYVKDGDRISADRTTTPTSVAQSLASIENLISQVDPEYLETTLDELNAAFPNPDTLGEIITSGQSIIATLDETWPQTQRVLRNSNTVLKTGVAVGDDLRQFAASAEQLTAWLENYDPKIRGHLDQLPSQVEELRRLTSLAGLKLPAVLGEMIDFTTLTVPYEPHLRTLLDEFPAGFEKFATVFENGKLKTDIILTDGNTCRYGFPDPDPRSTERKPIDNTRGCTGPGQTRGSVHAPGPVPR